MRVLFVIDTWGLIGGTERHASVVVPALAERGHEITVLCREDHKPGFADVNVIEFLALDGPGLSSGDRIELLSQIRKSDPEVVFFSALRNVDAASALLEVAPVVRYVHDHTLFCPGLNKYREDGERCTDPMGMVCLKRYWLEGGCICFKKAGHERHFVDPLKEVGTKFHELEIARHSKRVLTNSHYMRRELLKVGFLPAQTSVLYYFTRSNTLDQPRTALPPATEAFLREAPGEPVLFTPARLTLPDKGVDYLLTALGRVQRPFRAVIAGSGPAEDWLRQKALDDGVGTRTHFTGWLDSAGIESLYERANVVVCPSVWDEPFGLVGIEAMAHEKPVVAFGVGGIPEWLDDGDTGYLIPRKDVGAMAAAIDRLLANPEQARKMGANGRRVVAERFPREGHVDELERALHDAAGYPQGKRGHLTPTKPKAPARPHPDRPGLARR